MPRILFVAMPDSIHVARWITQVIDQDWELFLFPCYRAKPHAKLRKITVFGTDPLRPTNLDKSVSYSRWSSIFFYRDEFKKLISHKVSTKNKEIALAHAIQIVKPDIVHSLEFQHSGYLTLSAKKKLGNKFPTWITTNWGSDIYLFGRLPEHQEPIRQMLQSCDYYSCECKRDIQLARDMGYQGKVLPVLPNAGGIHVEHVMKFRQAGPVSSRKTIILKGYQNWAGRALVAFQAFRLCSDVLQDYTINIYSAGDEVKITAKLFQLETGISVNIVEKVSHEELLGLFGRARVYIGLSISDGISTSLLESIVMGAFPIQSCTACADEWIEDGKSGFIVPPEDPVAIADAIRRALTDDNLVNRAAEINAQTAADRLDYSSIQAQVIKMYRDIYDSRKE
ncbi:MAG: glycosyltransferase [Chloroflexi bacterium]|nr:glycosyltransferase [Chloroflexota bacterium]